MSTPIIGRIHVLVDNTNPNSPVYNCIYPETATSQIVDFENGVNYILINNMPSILANNEITIKKLALQEGITSDINNIVTGFISNAKSDINGNIITDTYSTKEELSNLDTYLEKNTKVFTEGTYKGQVTAVSELPQNASEGDIYKIVTNSGNTVNYYIYKNNTWQLTEVVNYYTKLNDLITSLQSSLQSQIDDLDARIDESTSGGSGIELADVTNIITSVGDSVVKLKWTDPDDVTLNGATLARWAGTLVVRKEGSASVDKNDGIVVIDSTVKNAYSETWYEDTGLTNGTTYYYHFFPHTSSTYTTGSSVNAMPSMVLPNLVVDKNAVTTYISPTGVAGTVTVTITSDSSGSYSVVSNDTSIANAEVSNNIITITATGVGTTTVVLTQAAWNEYGTASISINVMITAAVRYGYRIKESESDPYARVEYLFDAVGKTPAQMNFSTGIFNYGDWANDWFVTENKPCMVKNDGTVDYYLDPNDYSKKEDGGNSDVANTSYAGNAMAQFPLVWIKRYNENGYNYEIISNIQYDEDYKAYAHTRADGSIADFFYWSMFGGSKDGNGKMRSLSGLALTQLLTAQQEIDACKLNGSKWYTHTWSQRELIRTLCVLMGKSTDTQSVFGNGNCCSATSASSMLTTGTLKDKGQFFGYNDSTHQVKVFHIEKFWGDQWDRTAGLINNSRNICVKMTPEGQGYRVTDVTGYHATGKTPASGFISAGYMSEYGFIPTTASGSGTTYECDYTWANNGQLDYLLTGASADLATAMGGAFTFHVPGAPSDTAWAYGCGLSCEQPVDTE